MARRRSLNRRWSRRSANNTAILNDDSNIYDEDEGPYWIHLREDTEFLGRSAAVSEASSVLNPDSQAEISNVSGNYWENLQKTSQDLFSKNSLRRNSSRNSNTERLPDEFSASDSDHRTMQIKKRKIQLRKNQRSEGNDVFSQALESDEPAIESEPVMSKSRRKNKTNVFSLSLDETGVEKKRLTQNSLRQSHVDSNTSVESEIQKTKPAFRRKTIVKEKLSIFNKVLEADDSIVESSQEKRFIKPRSTFVNRKSSIPSSTRTSELENTSKGQINEELEKTISQPRAHLRNIISKKNESKNLFDEILSETDDDDDDETSNNKSRERNRKSSIAEISRKSSNQSYVLQMSPDNLREMSDKKEENLSNKSKNTSSASSVSEEIIRNDELVRISRNNSQQQIHHEKTNNTSKISQDISNEWSDEESSIETRKNDSQSHMKSVEEKLSQTSENSDQQIEESLSETSRLSSQTQNNSSINKSLNISMKSIVQSNNSTKSMRIDENIEKHATRFFNESIEETAPVNTIPVRKSLRTEVKKVFENSMKKPGESKETESEFESCISDPEESIGENQEEGSQFIHQSAYDLPDMNRSDSIVMQESDKDEDNRENQNLSQEKSTKSIDKSQISSSNRSLNKSRVSSLTGKKINSITSDSSVIPGQKRKTIGKISDDSETEENIPVESRETHEEESSLSGENEISENNEKSDNVDSRIIDKSNETEKIEENTNNKSKNDDSETSKVQNNSSQIQKTNKDKSQSIQKERKSGRYSKNLNQSDNSFHQERRSNISRVSESLNGENLQISEDDGEVGEIPLKSVDQTPKTPKRKSRTTEKSFVNQEKIESVTRKSVKPGPLSSKSFSYRRSEELSSMTEENPTETDNSKSKVPIDSSVNNLQKNPNEKKKLSSSEVIKRKDNKRRISSESEDEENVESGENTDVNETLNESVSKNVNQSSKTSSRLEKKSSKTPEKMETIRRRSERLNKRSSEIPPAHKIVSPAKVVSTTQTKKITSAKKKKKSFSELSKSKNISVEPVNDIETSKITPEFPSSSPENRKKSDDEENHLENNINNKKNVDNSYLLESGDEGNLQINEDDDDSDEVEGNLSKSIDQTSKSPAKEKSRLTEEFSGIRDKTISSNRSLTKLISSKIISSRNSVPSSSEEIIPEIMPINETPSTTKQRKKSEIETRKSASNKSVFKIPNDSVNKSRRSKITAKLPAAVRESQGENTSTAQTKIFDFFKRTGVNENRRKSNPTEFDKKLMETKRKLDIEMQEKRENFVRANDESRTVVNKDISSKLLSLKRKKLSDPKKVKVVDDAYIVNGKIYKQPKLPRPKRWVTDRLYKFLWKKMEPKYDTRARIKSEKFIKSLSDTVGLIQKRKKYEHYEDHLNDLILKMAKLGIIQTRLEFNHFCHDFMPNEFKVKVVPMLMAGNKMNIPFNPEKLDMPIIENEP